MADLAAALVLFCLLFFALRAGISYLRYLALDFVQVEESVYQIPVPAQMLVIRSEYVVTAPEAGSFVPALAAGSRVAVGGLIGSMQGEQSGSTQPYQRPVTAPQSGVVSFQLDGWEQRLSPEDMASSDWLYLIESAAEETVAVDAAAIASTAAGRPIAKIIDNLADTHILLVSAEPLADLAEQGSICLRLPADITADSDAEAAPASISVRPYEQGRLQDNSDYLLATLSGGEEALHALRYARVEIDGGSVRGMRIPARALIPNEEGISGVYCAGLRTLYWTPISVLLELEEEDELMVSGLVSGDRIVANPARAGRNQRIYN